EDADAGEGVRPGGIAPHRIEQAHRPRPRRVECRLCEAPYEVHRAMASGRSTARHVARTLLRWLWCGHCSAERARIQPVIAAERRRPDAEPHDHKCARLVSSTDLPGESADGGVIGAIGPGRHAILHSEG